VQARKGLAPLDEILAARQISVFGHIAPLESDVPAHTSLRSDLDLSVGRPLGLNWRRRPGRPRAGRTDQIRPDSSSSPMELWRRAIHRGHAVGVGVTQRPPPSARHDDDEATSVIRANN